MEFIEAKAYVRQELGIGNSVADELLILSGGDPHIVIECSRESHGLDQCKAKVIDRRIRAIEDKFDK